MKKYIDKLKSNKKVLYISVAILILLVGTTFAYVVAQLSGGARSIFNLNADTTDQLEFNVDKDISLLANQFNFQEGAGDLSDQAEATARLKSNSTKNEAIYNYNVYFLIDKNEFKYTTTDKKAEILLQVTNPNGNNLTELSDLKYDETLQGFDITEEESLLTIAEDYEITSNSSTNYTEQKWTFKVTFINLDTNQKANAGKSLDGKILIQQDKRYYDINIAVNNFPKTYGSLANMNCTGSNALYNEKYNQIEISQMNNKKTDCTLNYISRTNKINFNNYIINLEKNNSIQGNGILKSETFETGDFTTATALMQSEYGDTTQFYNNSYFSTSGTMVSNAFQYSETEWISQPSNLTSNNYYHITFTIPIEGYYQICYELSSGNSSNWIYFYKDNHSLDFDGSIQLSASQTSAKRGCIDTGYATSDTKYRIVQHTYGNSSYPIPTLKFSIKKASGAQMVDTGYRYEGEAPNNYVWFNNELWRIIGVFDESSHGVSNTNLVKIIRDSSIGGLIWNKIKTNDWETASLKMLLNNEYLNSANGTNGDNCLGYYSTSTEQAKTKCDYREAGIKDRYREMIQEATWYLGGATDSYITVAEMYKYERDETKKNSSNSASVNAKVGLMSASDYGFAVPAESCSRTNMNLMDYDNTNCTLNNWMYRGVSEWTITPDLVNGGRSSVNVVYSTGNLNGSNNTYNYGYYVYPVVYLNSDVYRIDGDGTISNPYIIGM